MTSIVLLALYGLALMVIAYLSLRNSDTIEDFLVAGRKQRRLLVTASMLASTIGGGITIGTVSRAYAIGFPAFWFIAAGGLAHFMQGILLSARVRASRAVTLPDLADKLAGNENRLLIALIILVTWTGIITAQFVAAAKVVTALTGLAHSGAVVLAAVFIVTYTLIGGQKSILRTDLFQFGFLALAILSAAAWLFVAKPPAPGAIRIDLFTGDFGFLDLIYYVAVLGGSYFICPMMFGRILSAKTPSIARRSSFGSGFGMILFAFVITSLGLWAKASVSDPGGLDPFNFLARNSLPPALGIFLMFGLLAAILSTADTVLITAAGIMEYDIVRHGNVGGVRLWTVLVGTAGGLLAIFQKDVIGILLKTYNGYTAGVVPALFVAIMFGSKRKLHPGLVFVAIAGGYAMGLAGSFMEESDPLFKILPLAGLVFSGVTALFARFVKQGIPQTG